MPAAGSEPGLDRHFGFGTQPPTRGIRRDQERLTGPVLDAFDAS